MSSKKTISTENAPAAIGPYSQAVITQCGKLLFTAGQIPMDPATSLVVEGDIQKQTRQVFSNLKGILEAAGSDFEHIVKMTVFLKDMNDFAMMNDVYSTYFTENPPARSAVEVARLPKDVDIEIECIAIVPE